VSLIPASMSSAIADRAKILGTLETLAIGAAGGPLFLWLNWRLQGEDRVPFRQCWNGQ